MLETTFETNIVSVQVIDLLSRRDGITGLVLIVKGLNGSVEMQTEIVLPWDYGKTPKS